LCWFDSNTGAKLKVMEDRIYNAIILNEPYADRVKQRIKTIETRMKRIIPIGDIIICCDKGKSASSKNAGNALCIVHVDDRRLMTQEDETAACIECVPGRIAFPLSNWRYFSYDFKFTDYKVGGSYQSIFQLRIPDFVEIRSIDLLKYKVVTQQQLHSSNSAR
jgi:hypothetical protein